MLSRRPWAVSGLFFLTIVSVVSLSFCSDKTVNAEWEVPEDAILFDVFHINYAWGFSCSGYYVDGQGDVHYYDCRALADSMRFYRGREGEILGRRYGMGDTITCHIGADQLACALGLVDEAATQPPLEGRQTGYDAGGTSYSAFLYDPKSGEWTEVPLATTGDVSHDPSTEASEQLVAWLKTLPDCPDTVKR